jgi:OmcA/MtrC family decaheme c-type cytochrome
VIHSHILSEHRFFNAQFFGKGGIQVGKLIRLMSISILMLFIAIICGCSGGGNGSTINTSTYTVSGSVSGVSVSGLKLTNNNGNELAISSSGKFIFTMPIANNSAYNVQVSQNPTGPVQACTVSNNSGVISGNNITNVNVDCSVFTLAIDSISNTAPGQTASVVFFVTKNGAPLDIQASPLNSLKATISGPTTDYATYWQARIQGTGSVGALSAIDAVAGKFQYTFPAASAIPPAATGSYAIGLEGYIVDSSLPGVRFAAVSPVHFFAVTDATPKSRRAVVDDAKCNACHATFTVHGGIIRGVQYCLFCHNPNKSNDTQVARVEGGTVIAPTMDMKVLIHKIHRGAALTQQPYIIWGTPSPSLANSSGTPINFGLVSYTSDLRDCKACHLSNTYNLSLAMGTSLTTSREFSCAETLANDTNDYCDSPFFTNTNTFLTPPITAACTSCHDAVYTGAHAATMTTSSGVESCQTCHGVGAINGTDLYHVPNH